MIPDTYEPGKLKAAVKRGGRDDLRFACDLADRIVAAVTKAKDEETLEKGFKAFRARNDYVEDCETNLGRVDLYPLGEKEISAPPKDKTSLGRFNPPYLPVLYLSTTREVALAECRALPSDICTVATFQTVRPIRIAKLLQVDNIPFEALLDQNPSEDSLEKWLLAQTANFVSRRVPDHDRDVHYRACNLIASAFKECGFEGLAYRTSFWSQGWRDEKRSADEDRIFASNLVLFDPEAAIPRQSALYRINWKRPFAEHEGGGVWTAKAQL